MLPDGRTVSYRVFGDPRGLPVVNCHGGLVSGLDAQPVDAEARASGVKVISPNRPGVGASSRKPDQGVLEWVRHDLEPLLDHLSVKRFAVMGWSEGGQYALAASVAMPDRVHRAALIGAALPLDDPATLAELNSADRHLAALSRRLPSAAAAYFSASRLVATFSPSILATVASRALGAHDKRYLRDNAEWFARAVAEGSRNPRGASDEYREFVAPWGFSPEDVQVPVDVHQGTEDHVIDHRWAEEFARRLPHASLHLYPGEGHFIALSRRSSIMDELIRGFVS